MFTFQAVCLVLTPQTKKKKPKKKKQSTAATPGELESADTSTPSGKGGKKNKGAKDDPLAGLDEVDRALAELDMK